MNLLSIAGFDPSAGAGVLLDLNVFRALGFHGAAVLTTVTVQNTAAAFRVRALDARFIRAQAEALARDMDFAGLKVGMIGSAANLREIGRRLDAYPLLPRVVDPVFRAGSGLRLIESSAVDRFLKMIEKRASVLTPNLDEAARLSGRAVRTLSDMRAAAEIIYERTEVPCLIKGGHLPDQAVNLLFDGRSEVLFRKRRLAKDVHGTGCLFSAALLAFLARTGDLAEAGRLATEWTHRAIRAARTVGHGRPIFASPFLP
jgi:hydroxymethylpyrimidine kinase/phosphomethylpyrimidine kinase